MTLTLHTELGVLSYVEEALHRAVRLIPEHTTIAHDIKVAVVSDPVITGQNGEAAFGSFTWPHATADAKPQPSLEIRVAAGIAPICREHGDSEREAAVAVVHLLLHEIVHYEQWRDGLGATEEGVGVRAMEMATLIGMQYSA